MRTADARFDAVDADIKAVVREQGAAKARGDKDEVAFLRERETQLRTVLIALVVQKTEVLQLMKLLWVRAPPTQGAQLNASQPLIACRGQADTCCAATQRLPGAAISRAETPARVLAPPPDARRRPRRA